MRVRQLTMAAVVVSGVVMAGGTARADSVVADGLTYSNIVVMGLRDGKVWCMVHGKDVLFDNSKVTSITIDKAAKFSRAEQSRGDPQAAAQLYAQGLHDISTKELRLLAQLRAIGATDAAGKYTDAMDLFLSVYAAEPIDAIWADRPTHIPAAGSTMLKQAADDIGQHVDAFSNETAKKNLRTLQMDLYTRAGATGRAANLATELSTGITPATAGTGAGKASANAAAPASTSIDITSVTQAVAAKKFDAAIHQADTMLAASPPSDAAAQLYLAMAQAYVGLQKPELAAATLLRVPAHYPETAAAPKALLQAAMLQKKLGHSAEAATLLKEIGQQYPDSPEAVAAKGE